MTIGEKLRTKRELLGISQKELAKKTGLTNVSICNIESDSTCNVQSLNKMCDALNLRIVLIDADEKPNKMTLNKDSLKYDVEKCCTQLDRVKNILTELVR